MRAALLLLLSAAVADYAAAVDTAVKPAAKPTSKKRAAPKPPPATPQQRADARESIDARLGEAMQLGIQNPAAMVPFYEMLYRRQAGGAGEPLRVLHFGDSHTASDDWPAALRAHVQAEFGDGGPGFTHAGHPFTGYRRFDSKGSMSKGWKPQGLLDRHGDGLYGISGVSLTASRAGERLTLEAEGQRLEVFYLRQPGGGAFTIEADGQTLETIPTEGEEGAGFWAKELAAGSHSLVLRTESNAPVRVYGWVLEKHGGMTWEMLGINGAEATVLMTGNEALLQAQIGRRDPALIVLAYGTNEARKNDWTFESYKGALVDVIRRLRSAAPLASVLVVGAPDQAYRSRKGIRPVDTVDPILEAQREAALSTGCAFWNWRAAMGGKGSMKQWVQAGLAQGDFVHLTAGGYKLAGDAMFALLMDQYRMFQSVRRQIMTGNENGSQTKDH